jgi:hypothetical protein
MMKAIARPDEEELPVWDAEVRPAVQEAFKLIAAGDKLIDVIEFERWLNRGWLKRKASLESGAPGSAPAAASPRASSAAAASAQPSAGVWGESGAARRAPPRASAVPGAARRPVAASRSAPGLARQAGGTGSARPRPAATQRRLPEISADARRLLGEDSKTFLQTLCQSARQPSSTRARAPHRVVAARRANICAVGAHAPTAAPCRCVPQSPSKGVHCSGGILRMRRDGTSARSRSGRRDRESSRRNATTAGGACSCTFRLTYVVIL